MICWKYVAHTSYGVGKKIVIAAVAGFPRTNRSIRTEARCRHICPWCWMDKESERRFRETITERHQNHAHESLRVLPCRVSRGVKADQVLERRLTPRPYSVILHRTPYEGRYHGNSRAWPLSSVRSSTHWRRRWQSWWSHRAEEMMFVFYCSLLIIEPCCDVPRSRGERRGWLTPATAGLWLVGQKSLKVQNPDPLVFQTSITPCPSPAYSVSVCAEEWTIWTSWWFDVLLKSWFAGVLISNVVIALAKSTYGAVWLCFGIWSKQLLLWNWTLMDLKDSQDIIASWIFDKIPLFLFSFALPCRREKN